MEVCLLWGLCELSSGVLLLPLGVNHYRDTVSLLQRSVIGFLVKCLQLVPPTQILSAALESRYLNRSCAAGCVSLHLLQKCSKSVLIPQKAPLKRNWRTLIDWSHQPSFCQEEDNSKIPGAWSECRVLWIVSRLYIMLNMSNEASHLSHFDITYPQAPLPPAPLWYTMLSHNKWPICARSHYCVLHN